MQIRRASHQDQTEIWNINRRSMQQACGGAYSEKQLASWILLLEEEGRVPATGETFLIVAETPDQIVGFGELNEWSGEIESLYVSPDHLNQGVGKQLLHRLEARAKEIGIQQLKLFSTLNAVGFYLQEGYEKSNNAVLTLSDGTQLGAFLMKKALVKL